MAELFIKRPVMTTLVMLAILMFGGLAYRMLPVSDLPNVDFPTILVTASLPGATPDTMASAVALRWRSSFHDRGPRSDDLEQLAGRHANHSAIHPEPQLGRAAQDVQAAITKSARDLPQNMPSPPSYQKVNPADQPVLYLTLRSPTLPLSQVTSMRRRSSRSAFRP